MSGGRDPRQVRRRAALAMGVALALAGAACSRRSAPPVPDAAVEHAAAARTVVDAAADHGPDAAPDGAAEPSRPHAHRAAAPKPPAEGMFKIDGAISKADAQTVLAGTRGRLDACYQKERAKDPGLKGRVTFRLLVDGRGRVPLAEVVSSTLGGGDSELCMVEALRDLKFPPSPSGAETTLSFPASFGR